MARYIDVDKLRDSIATWIDGNVLVMDVNALDNAPTADVVELKHGEWKPLSTPCFIDGMRQICVECSACKIQRHIPNVKHHGYYYCPNCGAKMDGKKEGKEE